MKTFISILRGINVGQKKVLMSDLKALYERLKLKEVTTYIQSGNVLFKADAKLTDESLAAKIEKALLAQYAFEVPVIIRSVEEMEKIIASNPFLKEKGINLEKLHVTFLAGHPDKTKLEAIRKYDYPPDRYIMLDKEVYLHCPESYGETKLSNKFFESKLGVTATTRNWNTVNKLRDMAVEL